MSCDYFRCYIMYVSVREYTDVAIFERILQLVASRTRTKRLQRRVTAVSAAYANHRDLFKRNLAICLERQAYTCCVLSYTVQRPGHSPNKLAAAQTKMEKRMLNTTYKDIMTNIWVREREDVSHIYNQQCENNEMVLGRPHQPFQRRPMDLACHNLETI